jgi:hypothetical protein
VTFTILSRFRSSAFTHFYPNRKIFARRAAWQGDLLRRDRGCSQYSSADGSTPRFCVSISMARWRTREYALPALVSEKNFAPAARALNFYRFTKTLHRMHFYHLMPKAAHFYRTLTLCTADTSPRRGATGARPAGSRPDLSPDCPRDSRACRGPVSNKLFAGYIACARLRRPTARAA